MGIHATLPGDTDQPTMTKKLRAALGHHYPLNAIRIVSCDSIAIEDDAGRDWLVVIHQPEGDAD